MSSERLRNEISKLGELLGNMIAQLHGGPSLELIESIRRLSRDARAGDSAASVKLGSVITGLDLEQMRLVIRSFSVFLDLANLAEDRERIRVLQNRTRQARPLPRSESIVDAIRSLKEAGEDIEWVQELISCLNIELVLTAHPTEAKRRSLRAKLREIRRLLYALDRDDPLQDRGQIEGRLRSELVKLWQTDFIRPWRPSVLQEVERGLAIAPTLWDVVPSLFDDLRGALQEYYPDHTTQVTPFLRYGTWIGGDRDGHPHVTVDISKQTLVWLRETAIDLHLDACERMAESLSMSKRQFPPNAELRSRIDAAHASWPELADSLAAIPPNEVYRRLLHIVHWRLRQTKQVRLDQGMPIGAYRSAQELQDDVEIIKRSLQTPATREIAENEVQPWCDRIATFGFHLARLDVRQDSSVHTAVMHELFREADVATGFEELDELQRQQVLLETLGQPFSWQESQLSTEAQETLSLFRLLRRTARRFGMHALGGHVVSMTRVPSDLLTILWLWDWSAGVDGGDPRDGDLRLPLIPLFETVDDLARAAETTNSLLSLPAYRAYVDELRNHQTIMVGYSDSTKDGGYLAACWALYRAQQEIFEITQRHGVRLTFFHGRGGSLGRGGGPAARGIRSLPSGSLSGSLRLTEQGEVLAERYDDPQIARRHLEQIAWSALLSAAEERDEVEPEWIEIMHHLSRCSRAAYRHLVEHQGFVDFFRLATPIREIERLPIGSRPARRKAGNSITDLRAIPWVFSWTQVRALIPAWFGVGTAVNDLVAQSEDGLYQLRRMYQAWPFVQAWVDNAALAMSKSDIGVFQHYARLAGDKELLESIADEIATEFAKTQQALCQISEQDELLSNLQWLAESIRVRNRYIDPLNLIQVELLRRSQTVADDDPLAEEHRRVMRLAIKGIAAGMRTTG